MCLYMYIVYICVFIYVIILYCIWTVNNLTGSRTVVVFLHWSIKFGSLWKGWVLIFILIVIIDITGDIDYGRKENNLHDLSWGIVSQSAMKNANTIMFLFSTESPMVVLQYYNKTMNYCHNYILYARARKC
jgi:hypothetical protein